MVDEQNRPCGPGASGRVLLTTLHNYAAPLIRYDIGDRAALAPDSPCGCGRGLPLLTRVSGKERPPLLLSDGGRKDSHALGGALNNLDGVYQFQLVQHRVDRFTLNLVPAPGYTNAHGERFAQALRDYVDGPVSIALKLHPGRIPSPNGKLRSIVIEA